MDYKLKYQLLRRKLFMKLRGPIWARMPESLQLDTHNYCTCDCIYCNPQHSFNLPHGWMPTEMFQRIVRYFKGYPLFCVAPFMDGEPMMDERLWDFCEYTQRYNGAQNVIDTNATVLKGRKNLLHPNLKMVRFTISANTPETYEVVQGRPYFHIAEETLAFYLKHKYPHQQAWLHFIVTKDNEHEVDAWLKRHSGIGRTVYIVHRGTGIQLNSDLVRGRMLRQSFYVYPDGRVKLVANSELMQYKPCPCYDLLGVSWQGDLLECVDFPYRYNYGNIRDTDPMEMWRERLRNKMDNECCNSCSLRFPNYKQTLAKWVR